MLPAGRREYEFPQGVRAIGKYAFWYIDALKEIIIPEGVSFIDDYAFADCSALERIILPESMLKSEDMRSEAVPH